MPFPGGRTFELHTLRTLMNQPSNRRGSNEEIVTTAFGQVGTQFDGCIGRRTTYRMLWKQPLGSE